MAIESLRVLILESSTAGAEAIAASLRAAFREFEFGRVESEDHLWPSLNESWDVVVANHSFDPRRVLETLREKDAAVPLIVIADSIGEEAAAECIREGAADLVHLDHLARLPEAVRAALRRSHEREQQESEAQLEVAERLAAGAGHEFNNLLTVISGYSGLLVREPQLPATVKSKLQEIDDAGRRGAQFTSQLLAFAHKHVRQPVPLVVSGVIAGLQPMLETTLGPGIELRLRLHSDAAAIYADRGELEQLIINLALNARDAMAGRGILHIETDRDSDGQVAITVTDHGCGMSTEVRARAFQPFFSARKGEGLGMGLSIVHGIVKAIGGRIVVESAVNRGSTFRVILPPFVAGAAPVPAPARESADEPPSSAAAKSAPCERILVVEDQRQLRTLIVSVLEPLGYSVFPAANAQEAIEICGMHGGSIDVLLTDVQMPDISGIELSRMVRESYPSIRTIFMSGGEGIGLAAKAAGRAEFLPKPFTPKTLMNKIRQALDSVESPFVLVVDDDPQIRNLLRSVLGEAGYRVEDAPGGRQALERVKQKTPDLLITDLIMPEVEGMETITRIRKLAPSLKIIAMSGCMDRVYLDTAKVLGASATFSKPLELEALLAAVSGLLRPHAISVS